MLYIWIIAALLGAAWWLKYVLRALARLRRQAQGAWTQLDEQLRARLTYAQEIIKTLTPASAATATNLDALCRALNTKDLDTRSRCQAEEELSTALRALENITDTNLEALNNRVRIATEFYNTQAFIYNTRLATMSLTLPARLAGYRPLEAFTVL